MTEVQQEKKVRNAEIRKKITETLRASGPLTTEEIAAKLGVDPLYVRPRVTDMKKAGVIVFTDIKRKQPGKVRSSKAITLVNVTVVGA